MIDQKPCLPECRVTRFEPSDPFGESVEHHAPACPNAKPAEPAIWDNTTICFGNDCPNCEREKAKPAEPPKVLTRNQAFLRQYRKRIGSNANTADACWRHLMNPKCPVAEEPIADPKNLKAWLKEPVKDDERADPEEERRIWHWYQAREEEASRG